jgi:hypothetical protein
MTDRNSLMADVLEEVAGIIKANKKRSFRHREYVELPHEVEWDNAVDNLIERAQALRSATSSLAS